MVLSAPAAFPATMNDPKDEKSMMATLQAMAQATIKKEAAALDVQSLFGDEPNKG
jgi:hypothetical protein